MIRSLAAFALMLRFGIHHEVKEVQAALASHYGMADLFLAQLEEDMKK